MGFTNQCQFVCLALILALGALASQAAARILQEALLRESHEQWVAQFGRIYTDDNEKEERFKIFKQNVELIESFNRDANKSYKLGLNHLADLTNEEFQASRNRFKGHLSSAKTTSFKHENVTAVPSGLDWRQKGAVTPVKAQGDCGCCWAFSAVAALEGVTKLSTGKLISLSEQELVDCDSNAEHRQGCEGGLMNNAFDYVQQNGGLSTEDNYPYKGIDGTCNANKQANSVPKINGHEDVPPNDEQALLKAVTQQPVSAAIDASGMAFQFYKSGVFTGDCGTTLDHGVAIVGYGTDESGTKYWLVKNSYGTEWGEQGYIRMQRDVASPEGLCGITLEASYPIA